MLSCKPLSLLLLLLLPVDNSPGTSNPSVVDDDDEEEGLPSPPLDEGAFFAPETTAIQLSEVLIYPLLLSELF
jgi:hypothetical protein